MDSLDQKWLSRCLETELNSSLNWVRKTRLEEALPGSPPNPYTRYGLYRNVLAEGYFITVRRAYHQDRVVQILEVLLLASLELTEPWLGKRS
jgi:hypothetical protein